MVRLTRYSYSEDRELPSRSTSSTRVSPFFGPYDNCNSVDELCDRFNRYHRHVRDMVNMLQVDAETQEIINQTPSSRPPLGFHNIRGANVVLQRNGRVARRRESFCKGLAFSNRPIDVDENVCIKLSEVATNWSGVLRFGVTNFEPDIYRNIPVPKFACPDLTTKEGYWAKALPERYSVEGNILHFYVNRSGELYYGINGSQKGLFLSNINTNVPFWLIVDIYGNSVALEFLEPSEFRPRRSNTSSNSNMSASRVSSLTPRVPSATGEVVQRAANTRTENVRNVLRDHDLQILRFHRITGRHITLNSMKDTATRSIAEYSLGYVFTDRPIKNNEVVCIQVTEFESMYNGGIAFGLTCCDPATLRGTDLPDDSSDLVELPDYWVGIKDVALQPKVNSILRFWITEQGEVFFELDKRGAHSILFVDNSIDLYMYFDVYGTTRSIKLLGTYERTETASLVSSSNSSASSSTQSNTRNVCPLSIPVRPSRETSSDQIQNPSTSSTNGLRVNLESIITAANERRYLDELPPPSLEMIYQPAAPRTPPRPQITPRVESTRPPAIPVRPSNSSSIANREILIPHRRSPQVAVPPRQPPPPVPQSIAVNTAIPNVSRDTTPENNEGVENDGECVLCMEAKINAVLYTCGHMCMCYSCAKRLTESVNPCCPICRATIVDVIRCFKS